MISCFHFLSDEIMQQDIRPLLAVDIIEQLHRQFALLSGRYQLPLSHLIQQPKPSSVLMLVPHYCFKRDLKLVPPSILLEDHVLLPLHAHCS